VQVARAVGGRVRGAVGVVLQFAVAPAGDAVDGAVANFEFPPGGIGRGAGRIVEFIAPDQGPAGRAGVRGAVVQQVDLDHVAAVLAVIPECQAVVATPVQAQREIPPEALVLGGDRLSVKRQAVERRTVRVTGQPGLLEAEMENEVHVTVTVDVLLVACRHPAFLVRVRLEGVTQADGGVIDGGGVESLGGQQHHRYHAIALVTDPALHINRDLQRDQDFEHALIVALLRQGSGIAQGKFRIIQLHVFVGRPQVGVGLEIIQEICIVGLVIKDGDRGLGADHGDHVHRVGQPRNHPLGARVLVVVEGFQIEGLLGGPAVREDQRSRHGREIAPGCRVARIGRVVDRDLGRIIDIHLAVQLHRYHRSLTFGYVPVPGGKDNFQLRNHGHSVNPDVVDVVEKLLLAVKHPERPAVHLGQREAVIGRAVTDFFAVEVGKRYLEILPAGKVVDDIDREPLRVVGSGSGVPVVENIHKQNASGVVAVEPETEAFRATPVLWRPGVDRDVFERVNRAGESPGDDVGIHLHHVVARVTAGNRCGGRVGGGYANTAAAVAEGEETNEEAVGIGSGGQARFEVVHDGIRIGLGKRQGTESQHKQKDNKFIQFQHRYFLYKKWVT